MVCSKHRIYGVLNHSQRQRIDTRQAAFMVRIVVTDKRRMLAALLSLSSLSLSIAGGCLSTYLFDSKSFPWTRLLIGATLGTIVFALLTFTFASFWGLTPLTIAFGAFASFAWPLVLTRRHDVMMGNDLRQAVREARFLFQPSQPRFWLAFAGLAAAAWILTSIFNQGFFEDRGAIVTGMTDNYADLAIHLGVVNGFVYGDNFPPEHPAFAGVRMSYPFLIDFHAAILIKLGLSASAAFQVQNLLLIVLLIGLLAKLTRLLTQDRVAAVLAPVLLLLNGGLGWTMLFKEGLPAQLPHEYTSFENLYRFNNSLIYWFIPMRSMLLATPLLCAVWILWWQAIANWKIDAKQDQTRLLVGAGVLTGLMPLVHAHSFVVLVAGAGVLTLLFKHAREWIAYAVTAISIAMPQILMVTVGGAAEPDKFFGWELGWTKEQNNFFWYWFLNTGLFIPLWIAGGIWYWRTRRDRMDAFKFLAPFALWFIIPNVTKLAPWIWDNIKILYVWYLGAIPLVAAILAHAWKSRGWKRPAAVIALLTLTFSAALDYYRQFSLKPYMAVYSSEDARFAELIRKETPLRSLLISAPAHNSHVLLAGRRLVMGYAGTIWTHGINAGTREEDVKAIYEGAPNAKELLTKHGVKYVIYSPKEESWSKDHGYAVNRAFLDQFPHTDLPDAPAGQIYRIYKVVP